MSRSKVRRANRNRTERRATIEDPNVPLNQLTPALMEALGGGRMTDAGVPVSPRAAMAYSSLFQGVTNLANDVGKIPLNIYLSDESGNKVRDKKHAAYRLLRRKPCAEMTANTFKKTLTGHAVLRGNGYAYIYRLESGEPYELVPLRPDVTYPVRVNGVVWYITTVGTQQRKLRAEDVLHIKGLGDDGIMGFPVVEFARQSIGLGKAAEKYGARYFGSGSQASGIIEYPGTLDEKAVENLRKSFNDMHQGLDRSHRIVIFEEGMKFNATTITNNAAQFLETREFQRVEMASWLNMPPHKLGDSSKHSYSSLEEENQSYLDSSLDPWFVSWEEECWDKLLSEEEKESESHTVEFNRAALMRTNAEARQSYYHGALQDGWMNRDEVRARENMNPIPNGEGQKFFVPLNMALTDQAPQPAKTKRSQVLLAIHSELLRAAAERIVTRVGHQAQRQAKKPDTFLPWLDKLEAKFAADLNQEIRGPVDAIRALRGPRLVPEQAELVAAVFRLLRVDLLAAADGEPDGFEQRVRKSVKRAQSKVPVELTNQVIRKEVTYA